MANLFSNNVFKNKRIIISGGAGDIGIAVALGFANAGATQIALLDKDIKQLDVAAEKIKTLGTECIKCGAT